MGEQVGLAAQARNEERAEVSAATVVVHLVRFESQMYRNLPVGNQLCKERRQTGPRHFKPLLVSRNTS